MRSLSFAMMAFSVACAPAVVRSPQTLQPERPSAPAVDDAPAPVAPSVPAESSPVSIDFVGNIVVPTMELLSVMRLTDRGLLDTPGVDFEDVLERDVLVLSSLYYDRGYITVKIEPPEVTKDRGRPVRVRIHVTEGQRFKLGKLSVVELGDKGEEVKPLVAKPKLLSNVALRSGDFFARHVMAEGIQRIALRYRDAGYAYADVIPRTEVHADTSEIDMAIEIRRGSLVRVAKVEIIGNLRVDPKTIRDRLEVSEGQLFSETKLDASRKNLLGSGLFDRVDCSTEKSGDGVIVRFEVVEP